MRTPIAHKRRQTKAIGLLLVLALWAGLAHAAEIARIVGPVHLHGRVASMAGPVATARFTFERSGWITHFTAHVLDGNEKALDHSELLCHSAMLPAGVPDTAALGLRQERGEPESWAPLALEEGKNELTFPKGYGYYVEGGKPYSVETMLVSADPERDADYRVKVGFDVTYAGDGPPLKGLTMRRLDIPIKKYMTPPGRRVYRKAFDVPSDGRIHVIVTHAHRYATSVLLEEAGTGRALYEGKILHDDGGRLVSIPTYSSAEGIPVAAGRSYVISVTYDNPRPEPVSAMGIMRIYFSEETPGASQ